MMSARVGIGIVTYNRKELVQQTARCVRMFTRRPDVDLVVADDGSSDGTVAALRQEGVAVVTGVNMGVAWNKNRALYLLGQVLRCEVVILLEDDTMPCCTGWEDAWIDAAMKWGHVSYAAEWMDHSFVRGSGTPHDPFLGRLVTAQCTSYSREALLWGGYYDSRFRGFGHEHVEHSRRLIRAGYGGTDHQADGSKRVLFAMIRGGVKPHPARSHGEDSPPDNNLQLAHQLMAEHSWRAPWRTIPELNQFRGEINDALQAHSRGFALRDKAESARAARNGWLARLLRRAP